MKIASVFPNKCHVSHHPQAPYPEAGERRFPQDYHLLRILPGEACKEVAMIVHEQVVEAKGRILLHTRLGQAGRFCCETDTVKDVSEKHLQLPMLSTNLKIS